MRALIVLFACMISVLTSILVSGQDVLSQAEMEQNFIEHLRGRDFGRDFHYANRQLSSLFSSADLSSLKRSKHDSVALQAAWHEVELTFPEVQGQTPYSPSAEKLQWFIGFLEGRVHVEVPQWWRDLTLELQAWQQGFITIPEPKDLAKELFHNAGLDGVEAPLDTTVTNDGGTFTLHVKDNSIRIPGELCCRYDTNKMTDNILGDRISALFTPTNCYVAVHFYHDNMIKLACISRTTGETVWVADVWCQFFGAYMGGPGFTWVTIEEQDQRIIVFGAGFDGIHVEGFRKTDGENVFRFTTAFYR